MEPDTVTIARNLKRLILHEEDQHFSIQRGGAYIPSPATLTDNDLIEHLAGRRTLGVKLIQPATLLVKAAAVDLDAASPQRPDLQVAHDDARRIQREAAAVGLPTALEFSGRRGWHVWIFVEVPLPAATMRHLLASLTIRAGCPGAEIYPRGDRITGDGRDGAGSTPIKLPCGLHQVSMGWSGFVGPEIVWDLNGLPLLPDQAILTGVLQQATPAQIAEALATLNLAPSNRPRFDEYRPDLTLLGGAEPACIAWLRQHGAPCDQTYNGINVTLARYAISRGLGDDAAVLMAGEVAQATRPEHTTGKQDPAEKVRNFHSVLKTARRAPDQYAFNCSYVRGSQELKAKACAGRACPAWPYGRDTTSTTFQEASPADTLVEREAIAFLIANPDAALPLALQAQVPPEAFLTHMGTDGDEPRHRRVWEAVLGLAGQEVRPSRILPQWEILQDAPINADQARWLETLIMAPVCTCTTFEHHLTRLRDTGVRELLATSLKTADEDLKRREALPSILDALVTSTKQLQTRQASMLVPMVELTGALLENLFHRPRTVIETPSLWLNGVLNGGWQPGRLYVLGAPPGSGKTTFAAWVADFAAASGTPVLFVSYEMSREQLYVYSLARAGEVNSARIEDQHWKDAETPAITALSAKIVHAAKTYDEAIAPRITIMEAGPEATPSYLKGAVGQVRTQAGVHDAAPVLLVIDYLQCMNTGDEALDSGGNETQKVSRLAMSLKQLARETGVSVIAISDITKVAYLEALRSGRLNMGAFRDSFKISHAADAVLLLQSEDIEHVPTRRGSDKSTATIRKTQIQLAQERASPTSYRARVLGLVEGQYPLDSALKASYAELSILKNRGGRLGGPLFVYERACHRFTPIELDPKAWEDVGQEDDGNFA